MNKKKLKLSFFLLRNIGNVQYGPFSKWCFNCKLWTILEAIIYFIEKVSYLSRIISENDYMFLTRRLCFASSEISGLLLKNQQLWKLSSFNFKWEKNAAKNHRMLVEICDPRPISNAACGFNALKVVILESKTKSVLANPKSLKMSDFAETKRNP